jgi:hypothetical protein
MVPAAPTTHPDGQGWPPASRPVPYITRWTSEKSIATASLRLGPRGLCYADEVPGDRDAHGVLWARSSGTAGQGRPQFKKVQALRQRDAMLHLRCQVCAAPASRTRGGVLFLDTDPAADAADIEDTVTAQPPVCLPCAALALRYCSRLARGHVAVRVRKPVLYGVFGAVYVPGPHGRLEARPDGMTLAYGMPGTRFVVAGQLLRRLRRVSLVDLDAELAAPAEHTAPAGHPEAAHPAPPEAAGHPDILHPAFPAPTGQPDTAHAAPAVPAAHRARDVPAAHRARDVLAART